MILQGLSAETLARLLTLARSGEDLGGLSARPRRASPIADRMEPDAE